MTLPPASSASPSSSSPLLNATLFLLVGLEIPTAVRDLDGSALTQALWLVLVVCVVLAAVGIVWGSQSRRCTSEP